MNLGAAGYPYEVTHINAIFRHTGKAVGTAYLFSVVIIVGIPFFKPVRSLKRPVAARVSRLAVEAAAANLGEEPYTPIRNIGERHSCRCRHEQIRRIGFQRALFICVIACFLHRSNPLIVFFLYAHKLIERAALFAIAGIVERQHHRRSHAGSEHAVAGHVIHDYVMIIINIDWIYRCAV